MSARLCLRSAARRRRPVPWRYAAHAALISLALLVQGCAADQPRVSQTANPSDPNARVPPTNYRPVLGSYAGGRPVEPAPWPGRNDGAMPTPKDGR